VLRVASLGVSSLVYLWSSTRICLQRVRLRGPFVTATKPNPTPTNLSLVCLLSLIRFSGFRGHLPIVHTDFRMLKSGLMAGFFLGVPLLVFSSTTPICAVVGVFTNDSDFRMV